MSWIPRLESGLKALSRLPNVQRALLDHCQPAWSAPASAAATALHRTFASTPDNGKPGGHEPEDTPNEPPGAAPADPAKPIPPGLGSSDVRDHLRSLLLAQAALGTGAPLEQSMGDHMPKWQRSLADMAFMWLVREKSVLYWLSAAASAAALIVAPPSPALCAARLDRGVHDEPYRD